MLLWRSAIPTPWLKVGLTKVGCPGASSQPFLPPRMEPPQPPWKACSCSTMKVFFCLKWESFIWICACCLSSCHWPLPRRVLPRLPHTPPGPQKSGIYTHWWDLPEPSAGLNSPSSQPLLVCQMLQSHHHLRSPKPDLLQYIHISHTGEPKTSASKLLEKSLSHLCVPILCHFPVFLPSNCTWFHFFALLSFRFASATMLSFTCWVKATHQVVWM